MSGRLFRAWPETWDRVVASDPGLAKLRQAAYGTMSMGTALVVEYGFAIITHAGHASMTLYMIFGAVLGSIGGAAVTGGTTVRAKTRIAVFFPTAFGLGLAAAVCVSGNTALMLSVYVVVMFTCTSIRRFGAAFSSYGLIGWLGFIIGRPLTFGELSMLLAAAGVASAWTLLLALTVLRNYTARTFRCAIRAVTAQARAVTRACANVLDTAAPTKPEKRFRAEQHLRARLAHLAGATLIAEGWSSEPGVLPSAQTGDDLRQSLIDIQHLLHRLAAASNEMADTDPQLAELAWRVTDRLARRDDVRAEQALHDLELAAEVSAAGSAGRWSTWRFSEAVGEFIELADHIEGLWSRAAEVAAQESAGDFTAVVPMAGGRLPASAAVAHAVAARQARWNPLSRLSLVNRQAVQTAVAGGLAILVGYQLSSTHYIWATLATFVVFKGTASRGETFLKGANRALGTLFGLFASIGAVEVTRGHTVLALVLVVVCKFCGTYLVSRSYAYMIFFLTIALSQLFSMTDQYSPGLMVMRLKETALGVVIGLLVAFLVSPLSTRDTVRSAEKNLLAALAGVLTAAAERIGANHTDSGNAANFDALNRILDFRYQQLALVTAPLTHPLPRGSATSVRHRLALFSAATTHARAVVVASRDVDTCLDSGWIATACQALVTAVNRLAEIDPKQAQPAARDALAEAEAVLLAWTPTVRTSADGLVRPLLRLHGVLSELVSGPGQHRMSTRAPENTQHATVLTGKLVDNADAPILDGLVLVTDTAGRAVARVNADRRGLYRVTGCPPGRYVAAATAQGHEPESSDVRLGTDRPQHLSFALNPSVKIMPTGTS